MDYKNGRISRQQLHKVQVWAKAKDAMARKSFDTFRKQNSKKLVKYMSMNK